LDNFKYIFIIGSKTNNTRTILYHSDNIIDKNYLDKTYALIKFLFKVILCNNCVFPSNFTPEIYLSCKLKNIKISNNEINLINHVIGRAFEAYIKLKVTNQIINTNLLLIFFYIFQTKFCNRRVNFILNFDFLEFININQCKFWEPCFIFFNLLKSTLSFLKFVFMIYF